MSAPSRRTLLAGAATLAGAAFAGGARAQAPAAPAGPFELAPLPYAYGALEPVIDAETMELHHSRHHRAYVDNLNRAVADHPQLGRLTVEALLRRLDEVPEAVRATVRNNGGGHANHQAFWALMRPGGAKAPEGALKAAIDGAFGSFDAFKTRFEEAGGRHFGSGWVWLASDLKGEAVEVVTTPNQDHPLMGARAALLGNDLWEHAYYLKHRNRRADYLKGWWAVVNWTEAGRRFDAVRAGDAAVLGGGR